MSAAELSNAQGLALLLRDERLRHKGTLRSLEATRKDCATWRNMAEKATQRAADLDAEADELRADLEEARDEVAKLRLQIAQAPEHMTPVRAVLPS